MYRSSQAFEQLELLYKKIFVNIYYYVEQYIGAIIMGYRDFCI